MTHSLTLALVLALAPVPSDTAALKWSLKEGDVFYVKNTQVMDMTMGIMGQNIEQKQESTSAVRYKVKSVKLNETVVEMTTLDFRTKVEGPAGAADAEKLMEKMKGLTFTATLDDKMNVVKMEGYDKFIEALAGDDANKKQLMQTVMPESTFSQLISQTFAIAPEKPVKVGDAWTRDHKMPMGPLGDFAMKQTFKLDTFLDGLATIGSKMEMSFKPGAGGLGGVPVQITKADLKMEDYAGTYKFDTKLGRLTDGTSDGTIIGTMTASAGGKEIEMTLKMKMKQTTAVSDKNPVKE